MPRFRASYMTKGNHMRRTVAALMGVLLAPLLLSGCSDSDGGPAEPATRPATPMMKGDSASRPATAPAKPKTFTDADYAEHVRKLRAKIPADARFTVVIQKPFVVIGDESPSRVRMRAKHTVKWAVDLLKKDYFKKDPDDILDIWLFRDRASYLRYTREIFNDTPATPFGYYADEHKALIMNIATGAGTLVHEIVHPFVASNFPKCPAWFNEGLGSLYEQSAERRGKIVGLTNWRLKGLKKAIMAGDVPSFKRLTHTTTYEFYRRDPGTNYGQTRYLCYYLQEHGLLRKFYRAFVANHKTDPTGYETLKKVLGVSSEKEMSAFKKRWEAYVMKLRFP